MSSSHPWRGWGRLALAAGLFVCTLAGPAPAPLQPPVLDDRSYDDLVAELVRRIPVHSPEWTDHNDSDPGVAMLELFDELGHTGVNALIDEFRDDPPWAGLPRDDPQYWRELGYVAMEAGLVLIVPNHVVGSDWPRTLWPQTYPDVLEQEEASFLRYAVVPEPATFAFAALGAAALLPARRRQRGVSGVAATAAD